MHVGPEHGGEAIHDDVWWPVVVDACDVPEADDSLKFYVRDHVGALGWSGGICDDDVEGDLQVG